MAQDVLVPIFIALHTFGWISAVILLITVVLSAKVVRHYTWLNLNLSWIFACFVAALLFTSGQLLKEAPSHGVCLTQSAAMLGAQCLTAGTTLAFVVYLWTEISFRITERPFWYDALLAFAPFIFPTIIVIVAFQDGYYYPSSVILAPSKMTCMNISVVLSRVVIVYCTALMAPTIILSVIVGRAVFRHWHESISKMIRLAIFMFFSLLGVIINVVVASGVNFGKAYGVPNILVSLAPVSYVLVFGTQQDIFMAWMSLIHKRSSFDPYTYAGSKKCPDVV